MRFTATLALIHLVAAGPSFFFRLRNMLNEDVGEARRQFLAPLPAEAPPVLLNATNYTAMENITAIQEPRARRHFEDPELEASLSALDSLLSTPVSFPSSNSEAIKKLQHQAEEEKIQADRSIGALSEALDQVGHAMRDSPCAFTERGCET
mmetsp:Transcript_49008/g.106733  ORF Transcript_49008/g.106733 Transcript_49008/m.106733 type:complete len:151 (+) Transcript_49008:68-520(+)